MALDTHVYIDGFNLYYGALRGTPCEWLDLERFCDQLLRKTPSANLLFHRQVDARPNDPDQPTQQHAHVYPAASQCASGHCHKVRGEPDCYSHWSI